MLPGDSAGQAVQQAFLGRWFCIGRLKANKFLLQSRPGSRIAAAASNGRDRQGAEHSMTELGEDMANSRCGLPTVAYSSSQFKGLSPVQRTIILISMPHAANST